MIGLLNEYGARWAAYFGPALVQNTLFLALVLLILHRLRYASARIRYAVGAVGLLKLLLPPLVPLRFGMGTAEALQRVESISGAIRFMPSGFAIGGAPAPPPEAGLGLLGAIFVLWAAVAGIYVAVSIASTLRLAWTLRGAERISDVEGFSASTPISLFISKRIAVPMTLGLFPRRIFVPAAWASWSDECKRMALRHEAAHIARRDGLVQALQIVAQALYFFHPLVLILGRRLGECREMACDDLSAGSGGCAGIEYSRFLVEIAESVVKNHATCESASTLIKKKNELLNRVSYQMKGGAMPSKGKTVALLAVLLMLMLPLSWYHTSAASVKEERQARSSQGRERGDRTIERSSRTPHQRSPRPAPPAEAESSPAVTPAPPAAPMEPAGANISIEISGVERIVVDGEAIAWAMVKEQLKGIMGGDDKKIVKLQCAADTPMERIHAIHEVLGEIGLDRIEYRNGKGYGAPLVLPPADIDERLDKFDAIAKVDLRVDASGQLTLDGEPIELSKLSGVVMKRIERVPSTIVIVRTMEKTLYKDFLGVLAALKKADAKRIVIKEPVGF